MQYQNWIKMPSVPDLKKLYDNAFGFYSKGKFDQALESLRQYLLMASGRFSNQRSRFTQPKFVSIIMHWIKTIGVYTRSLDEVDENDYAGKASIFNR